MHWTDDPDVLEGRPPAGAGRFRLSQGAVLGVSVALAAALGLLPAVVLAERLDGLQVRLDADRAVSCELRRAQAVAPAAPGAPRDAGSLTVAVRAREAYVKAGCEAAGYGPVPPVSPWRGR